MSCRKTTSFLATVVAINCIVVGLTLVGPNMKGSTGSPAFATQADFDQTFASIVTPPREDTPAMMTQPDFDEVFASVSVRRAEDTPPNRERLRNAGWRRILGTN